MVMARGAGRGDRESQSESGRINRRPQSLGVGGRETTAIKDYSRVSGLRMLVTEVREGHCR